MPSRRRPSGSSSKSASCSSRSTSSGSTARTRTSGADRFTVRTKRASPRSSSIGEPSASATTSCAVEALEHPPDRRLRSARAPGVDRTRDDQPVDRTGHRDVVQPEPLGRSWSRSASRTSSNPNTGCRLAAGRVHHAEPEAPVRERDDLVRPARPADVAPRVRDDHDLELEPLGGVDREQPDGPASLLLGDGLELPRAERVLLADEADEAGDVGTTDRLVVASQAPELAEVREPAGPVPAREHGEVVVVLGDDPLAQRLEPEAGRGARRDARSAGGTRGGGARRSWRAPPEASARAP